VSRFSSLLETFQNAEETAAEAEELAHLVREDPERAATFYDALMLDADLYQSYAGIAQLRASPRRPRNWSSPKLVLIWTAAIFVLVTLAVVVVAGRPSSRQTAPAAPGPAVPADPPPPRASERETEHHGSKKEEIEREYQKGLREVERKRAEGESGEADKKLREIEREREKQLRELERRR
jgi:hypothetical protein